MKINYEGEESVGILIDIIFSNLQHMSQDSSMPGDWAILVSTNNGINKLKDKIIPCFSRSNICVILVRLLITNL